MNWKILNKHILSYIKKTAIFYVHNPHYLQRNRHKYDSGISVSSFT